MPKRLVSTLGDRKSIIVFKARSFEEGEGGEGGEGGDKSGDDYDSVNITQGTEAVSASSEIVSRPNS